MDSVNSETTKILIVSDSRGYELKDNCKISHGLSKRGSDIGFQLDFIHKGGLMIESLVELLDHKFKTEMGIYDFIYVFY